MVRLGGYGVPVEPNRHRLIRNEAWPRYPENFPVRVPIEVVVHIWWAHGWPPQTLPAIADRWNDSYVRVMLRPPVHGRDVVWLRPGDVRRR
jgi:hypothetical protein